MSANNSLQLGDYDTITMNLSRCAKGSILEHASPVRTQAISNLYALSGGYSRVYKISLDKKPMALRFWFKNPGKVHKRFPLISEFLKKKSSPYFVDIKYIPDAIKFNKKNIPVSLMEWIEGDTLSIFLQKNINNKSKLITIANEFVKMVKSLHELRISHGDLQTENIKIYEARDKLELRLIDYDSLYIPSLSENDLDDFLIGLDTFQHPNRIQLIKSRSNYYKSDYFSELVIYLSLITYISHPNLWSGPKEGLLFDKTDFEKPNNSKIFSELLDSSDPQIIFLAEKLKLFCKSSPIDLVPLENLLTSFPDSKSNASKPSQADIFEPFFQNPPKSKIQKSTNKEKSDFEHIFKNTIIDDIKCQNGHKRPNPNPSDPYCPICNDISSFFGIGQSCKNCKKYIPKDLISTCPNCGVRI